MRCWSARAFERDYPPFVEAPSSLLSLLVPKLHLGTRLLPKLSFPDAYSMRSRYRIHEKHTAHFITATTVAWLPIFTKAARCDIVVESLRFCQAHKDLKIHAWVILDNHLHAILAARDLSRVLADLKRHTARRLIDQLQGEKCDWLLNQLQYFCAAHKIESEYQLWQESSHPQAMLSDEMMLQKLDYLHNNPVKRGLVASPEHWLYSSAHEWLPGSTPALRCDPWR